MEKQQDYSLYKYYKGEKENPFVNKDKNAPIEKDLNYPALWWDGKRRFHEGTTRNPISVENIGKDLQKAIDEGYADDILTDESIDFKKRTLMFYLDLWGNKWFPYDGFGGIYKY